MMVIGLTGGIASGKSTVAAMLQNANIPVIDADQLAHELTKPESPLLKKIATHFGKEIIKHDGSLDRAKLAKVVFNDQKKLLELEKILHPQIEALRLKKLAELKEEGHKVAVYMAPLIFEKGIEKILDKTILITAGQELMIKRAKQRDGLSIEEVKKRLKAQMSDEEKKVLADEVIDNNGSLKELYQKLALVFKKINGFDLPEGQYL